MMLKRDERLDYPGLNEKQIHNIWHSHSNSQKERRLLLYDRREFIEKCFDFFLNREGSQEDVVKLASLMDDGLSKEGVLYYFYEMEEFAHRLCLDNIKWYKAAYLRYEWDVNHLIRYDGWDFIKNCYREILGRAPSAEEVVLNSRRLAQNVPKEGIIYLISSTEEAMSKKSIRHRDHYKEIYEDYIRRREDRRIRGLRSLARRIRNAALHRLYINEIRESLIINQNMLMYEADEMRELQKKISKASDL